MNWFVITLLLATPAALGIMVYRNDSKSKPAAVRIHDACITASLPSAIYAVGAVATKGSDSHTWLTACLVTLAAALVVYFMREHIATLIEKRRPAHRLPRRR